MLKVIKIAAKELQTTQHVISSCRADLDVLIADAHSDKSNNGHALCDCKLGTRCAGETPNKLAALCFANGAVKI